MNHRRIWIGSSHSAEGVGARALKYEVRAPTCYRGLPTPLIWHQPATAPAWGLMRWHAIRRTKFVLAAIIGNQILARPRVHYSSTSQNHSFPAIIWWSAEKLSVLVSGEYVNSLGRSLYLVEISDPVVHLIVHSTS